MNKELLEELIRKVIQEELGKAEQPESEYKRNGQKWCRSS